jgi:Lipocalin-like domain
MQKYNFRIATIAFFFVGLVCFTSCKKERLRRSLEGEWDISSLVIDGLETKGTALTKSTIEFDRKEEHGGEFEWYLAFTDGTAETEEGEYELDAAEKELELSMEDGEIIKFDLEIEEDELELKGTTSTGETVILKAKKED